MLKYLFECGVPLLLLIEKKLSSILISIGIFCAPTILIQLLFGQSPAFIEEVVNYGLIDRTYAASFEIGSGLAYLYFVFTLHGFVLPPLPCRCGKRQNPPRCRLRVLSRLHFAVLVSIWHPQWAMFFSPAMILTTVIAARSETFLLLDLVGWQFSLPLYV